MQSTFRFLDAFRNGALFQHRSLCTKLNCTMKKQLFSFLLLWSCVLFTAPVFSSSSSASWDGIDHGNGIDGIDKGNGIA